MIIGYDRAGGLSTDQKLQSLMTSIQLALNEVIDEQAKIQKALSEIEKTLNGSDLLMRGEE